MSDVIINEQSLIDIGDAIREKLGVEIEYLPSEMAAAINSIIMPSVTIYVSVNESPTSDSVSSLFPNTKLIYFFIDTYITDSVSANDIIVDGATILSAETVNSNVIKIEWEMDEVDSIQVVFKTECFRFYESAIKISVPVEATLNAMIGMKSFMGIKQDHVRSDSGSTSINLGRPLYLADGYTKSMSGNLDLSANSVATQGDSYISMSALLTDTLYQVLINKRDTSSYNVYYALVKTDDCGEVAKIRWEGFSPYNAANINIEWELYMFDDGGFMIYLDNMSGTLGGSNSIFGKSFNINSGKFVSVYLEDGVYRVAYEKYVYDSSKKLKYVYNFPINISFEELLEIEWNELYKVVHSNSYIDSGSLKITTGDLFSFPFNSGSVNAFTVYADSYISIDSKVINIDQRDTSIYDLTCGIFSINDLGVKAFIVCWRGASQYSGSIDRLWRIFFFDNGDVMIHIITKGSNSGTNSFNGVSFTTQNNSYISFYRQNIESTSFDVGYEIYDIEKHIDLGED